MKLHCSVVIILLLSWTSLSFALISNDLTAIFDTIFTNYDKRVRPNYGRAPLKVEVTGYILDLFNVDEQAHEFTINMYFRHHWNDPRLTFKPPAGVAHISLDQEQVKKLWLPDTFFVNDRKTVHHSIGSGVTQELTRIAPDGDITRSARLTICASCKMDLGWYPFDKNLCVLDIESYGSSAEDFMYSWKFGQHSVRFSDEASSLKYSIKGINLREKIVSLSTANYSRLAIELFLTRRATREVQERYFPTFVITSFSFLTLFIGTLIFRTQMSLSILATMLIFMGLSNPTMPKVSYQTALDLYIFVSFLTISNVVIVNFLMQYFYKPIGRKPSRNVPMQRLEENNAEDIKETVYDDAGYELIGEPQINNFFEAILHKICVTSKYIIPASYLAFNLIYWMVVLIGSSGYPDDFLILEDRDS